MPTQAINDRELIGVICAPMTETARAEKLGLPRPTYYRHLCRLARTGVIRPRGHLEPGMKLRGSHPRSRYSGTHHAPVQYISWDDSHGRWETQGQLLDKWRGDTVHNTSITIRWQNRDGVIVSTSFEVRPVNRWSIQDTFVHLPVFLPWNHLQYRTLKNITVAIARFIDAEAIVIPEDMSEDHFKRVG